MKNPLLSLSKSLPFRSLPLAGVCALATLTHPAANAQSAANWLASAPAPNRTMLFGASELTAPALGGESSSLAASEALPEAPEPQLALEPKPKRGSDPAQHIARKNTMVIPSDWHAQRLTPRQKVKAGLEDLYSFPTVASWFLSAGWEQLINGAPNYGTDKGAFGERLGAAALRGTSQNLFTEAILAPIFHEDERYYVEGPSYNPVHRTLYAVTRTLVTRKDDGRKTINGALLLGYAGSAALTPTYYPQVNRNFGDVASVYAGGIGGAALGFFISEFSQDAFRALHLSREE